jgi:hypothetical protein
LPEERSKVTHREIPGTKQKEGQFQAAHVKLLSGNFRFNSSLSIAADLQPEAVEVTRLRFETMARNRNQLRYYFRQGERHIFFAGSASGDFVAECATLSSQCSSISVEMDGCTMAFVPGARETAIISGGGTACYYDDLI